MPPTRRQRGGAEFLALDCEMIQGERGQMLAEVAIVNRDGDVVYHSYVRPSGPVVDYRTAISGIEPEMLRVEAGAKPFHRVQKDVLQILQGNILVGHALANDLKALRIQVDPRDMRNTAIHPAFKTLSPVGQLQPRKLAMLHSEYVGNADFQQGAHSAVADAQASMRVFLAAGLDWNAPVVHEGPTLRGRVVTKTRRGRRRAF